MRLVIWKTILIIVITEKIYADVNVRGPPVSNSWRDTGRPSIRGPPSPDTHTNTIITTGARLQSMQDNNNSPGKRPGSNGQPGRSQPGTELLKWQAMSLISQGAEGAHTDSESESKNIRLRKIGGSPGRVWPPGMSKFAEPQSPGSPMKMRVSDGETRPPGYRGAGWRPGPPLMFAEMRQEEPNKSVKNLTIDQVILKAYGGVNKTMEAPNDPENKGMLLAEYDMMLSPNQFRAFYGHAPFVGSPGEHQTDTRDGNGRNHEEEHTHSAHERYKRKALKNPNLRWTEKIVPYEFVFSDFSDEHYELTYQPNKHV